MKVKIINQKIAEVNTKNSDLDLPESLIGTSLSKYLYSNGEFTTNSLWVDVSQDFDINSDIVLLKKFLDWVGLSYLETDTKEVLLLKISNYKDVDDI